MMTNAMILEQLKNAPTREYTKKEAQDSLRELGILDKRNHVTKEYRDIVVSVRSANE